MESVYDGTSLMSFSNKRNENINKRIVKRKDTIKEDNVVGEGGLELNVEETYEVRGDTEGGEGDHHSKIKLNI